MGYINKKRNDIDLTFCRSLNLQNVPASKRSEIITQSINDNIVFLNSAISLLSGQKQSFATKADYENYVQMISSSRPELQQRIATLNFISYNKDVLLTKEYLPRLYNIQSLVNYVMKNSDLLEKTPTVLGIELDLNYAMMQAIRSDEFSLDNPENPVRICWDNVLIKTNEKPRNASNDFAK